MRKRKNRLLPALAFLLLLGLLSGCGSKRVKQTDETALGVDVGKFQGTIDWQKVAASGVDFAMIRLGYRGYETGKLVMDSYAVQNLEGAAAAGLPVGVYFFSQAVTIEEAVE